MFLTDLQVVACPGSALLEHSPFLPFFVFSLIMLIREAIRYKKCSFLTLFKRGGEGYGEEGRSWWEEDGAM